MESFKKIFKPMPALLASIVVAAFPGKAAAIGYFATYQNNDFNVPEDFLKYVQRANYNYVLINSTLDVASSASDWNKDAAGKRNGTYNWSSTGTKKLYNNLKREFKKANKYGLKMIPWFELGGHWGSQWGTTNEYIEFNEGTVGGTPVKTPCYASQAKGMETSFPAYLDVLKKAFADAKVEDPTIQYSMEYVMIGQDEMYGTRPGGDPGTPVAMAAMTSVLDRDFINANSNGGSDYPSAYYKLISSEIARRVNDVKAKFPGVKSIVSGNAFDRQGLPGKEGTMAWSPNGNWDVFLTTKDMLTRPEMLNLRGDVVMMPWQNIDILPTQPPRVYDAEDALNYFNDNGYKFLTVSAYEDEFGSTIPAGRRMMHEFVRAARLSKFASNLVGMGAASWISNNSGYWTTTPRSVRLLVYHELAKAANFYRSRNDIVRLKNNAGKLKLDLYTATPSGYSFTSSNHTLATSAAKVAFTGQFNGGFCNAGINCGELEDLVQIADGAESQLKATLYRSTGTGFVETEVGSRMGSAAFLSILPADFNGDGKMDLIRLSDVSGSLGWRVFTSDGAAYTDAWAPSTGTLGQSSNHGFLTGDFNADGFTDVFQIIPNGSRTDIQTYISSGSDYAPGSRTQFSSVNHVAFLTGDYDNDGKTDIFQIWNNNGRYGLIVARSNGSIFQNVYSNTNIGGATHISLQTGDIDGDGRTDILQLWNNNNTLAVEVYRSTGTGFVLNTPNSINLGSPTALKYLVADWNADGKSDIIKLSDNAGNLAIEVLKSNGVGFASAVKYTSGMGTSASINSMSLNVNDDK